MTRANSCVDGAHVSTPRRSKQQVFQRSVQNISGLVAFTEETDDNEPMSQRGGSPMCDVAQFQLPSCPVGLFLQGQNTRGIQDRNN